MEIKRLQIFLRYGFKICASIISRMAGILADKRTPLTSQSSFRTFRIPNILRTSLQEREIKYHLLVNYGVLVLPINTME